MNRFNTVTSRFQTSNFAKDIFITTFSQFAVMVIAFLINKTISYFLSPTEFAIFSIAGRTATVLAFLMLLGLGIAIPRYIAIIRAKKNHKAEANMFYAAALLMVVAIAIVSLVTVGGKETLAQLLFNDSNRSNLIVPTLLFAIGTTVSSFVYAYFRGIDKFKQYSVLQVVFQVVNLAIVVYAGSHLVSQLTLRGMIILFLSIVTMIYIIRTTYRSVSIVKEKVVSNSRELLAYCLPRVPGEVFLFSFTVLPLAIINARFGLHSTAAFATAVTLTSIVTPLFQFVGTALLPYVSKHLATGATDGIQSKVKKLRVLYLVIAAVSAVFMWFLTDFVITILFNKTYTQFSDIVRVVYLSVVPYSMYLLLRNPLDAISKIPFNTFNLGVSLGVLVLAVVTVKNIHEAAWAFVGAYLILGVLSELSWHSQHKKKIKKQIDDMSFEN